MKALRGIDGSICGAILSNRPSTLPAVVPNPSGRGHRPQPRRSCLSYPDAATCPGTIASARNASSSSRSSPSYCPKSTSWLQSTFHLGPGFRHQTTSTRSTTPALASRHQTRHYSQQAAAEQCHRDSNVFVPPNKEELLSFVDHQNTGTVEDHLEYVRDPYYRRYAQPDGPHISISDKKEDITYPSQTEALRGDPEVAETLTKLRRTLSLRMKHPSLAGLRTLYSIYCNLPKPRMLHLPAKMRQRFLKVMGSPKRRNSKSMLRFFSVIGEVQDCGLTLRRREWNAALALASQYVRTTDAETEATLRLWNEMERSGGEKGNGVTFNILFDAAAKSGNFVLAEKIHEEMESRHIPFNRYHRTSLIHFFGLKKDQDGIRAAYKEMVDAGEMIDTVVLNCLITSFLMAGDEQAALRVYEYMKSKNAGASAAPAKDYHMSRVSKEVLLMFGKVGRGNPSMRSTLQGMVSSTPDLSTYRILLYHYGVTAGNINRVIQCLDEMKWFDLSMNGAIFLILFKAFTQHGGRPYLGWTEERLRSVFESLLQTFDAKQTKSKHGREMYIDTWLAGWALKAFHRCAGKDAVVEVYAELKSRWQLNEERVAYMEEFLQRLLLEPEPKKQGFGGRTKSGL